MFGEWIQVHINLISSCSDAEICSKSYHDLDHKKVTHSSLPTHPDRCKNGCKLCLGYCLTLGKVIIMLDAKIFTLHTQN